MHIQQINIGDQIRFDSNSEANMEYGFVIGKSNTMVYCRFWSKTVLGSLRTLANSESCEPSTINKTGLNVPQQIINEWLKYIKE